MTLNRIEAAAGHLADLRLRRNGMLPPIEDLPDAIRPRSVTEAYAVQHHLRGLLANNLGPVAGWKIGCTTEVMQTYLNVDHPCMGTLFASQVHQRAASLRAADYRRLGLECEIAVRLSADLSPGDDPAQAIAAVMCSVEIVEERFTDFSRCARESLIADDFFSRGCVLGPDMPLASLPDLAALTGGFTVNGIDGSRGQGAAILGHPLTALTWLAEARSPEGGLKAGEVVTLGSVVKTIYPEAGDRVMASFDGLGSVEIDIT